MSTNIVLILATTAQDGNPTDISRSFMNVSKCVFRLSFVLLSTSSDCSYTCTFILPRN